jgi:hypothetical protein
MVGHRIVSGIIAWLKTVLSGMIFFSLLILLMHDSLDCTNFFDELIFVILNVLIIFFVGAIYISFVLIPLSFIDGTAFGKSAKTELLIRYFPFITAIMLLILLCFFPFKTSEGALNGRSIIFFLNLYHAAYAGIIFFIHTSKNRELKKQKHVNTSGNKQLQNI